jgi:hypothetical protein
MKYLLTAFVLVLTGCNATTPTRSNNVIVADGTEIEQFEAMVFCSDKEGFMVALGNVSSKLTNAWDEVLGKENKQKCTIRISIDKQGNILGHSVVTCENEPALKAVLKKATPVPVPQSECLQGRISGVKYQINSGEGKS